MEPYLLHGGCLFRLSLRRRAVLALALALGSAGQAWSQAVPSAEELLREQERTRVLRRQQEHSPAVHLQQTGSADSGRLRSGESPCFTIDRIRLKGDAADQFLWALAAAQVPRFTQWTRVLLRGAFIVVPWFAQKGLGVQYKLPDSLQFYLDTLQLGAAK